MEKSSQRIVGRYTNQALLLKKKIIEKVFKIMAKEVKTQRRNYKKSSEENLLKIETGYMAPKIS